VFGAGGGTSSYLEAEETDLVILWGSNARETHPIFFHHMLKAVRRGAPLYVVDPRRTKSAEWADGWLGIDVGTDIALSNAVAREIIHAGLANRTFIERGTSGYEEYAASVEPWTLAEGERVTGVPGRAIRDFARAYATAGRAQLCWTLGITEHHNATDCVLSLINLALLTGHVGRYGSGLSPLRGQNNVQGGGDMGAIPTKFVGFQDVLDEQIRAKFERAYGRKIPASYGKHVTEMLEAMDDGELTALYCVGENPMQSEPDSDHTYQRLTGLDHLVVQDIVLTRTAELADVVLPSTAAWCESEGTVTNSERRVQRVRKALDPPPGARDDVDLIALLARRLGSDWGNPTAEDIWNELRTLSPMHAGMSYERIDAEGGIQWPRPYEDHPEPPFLHGRLWETDPQKRGEPAPFTVVRHELPVDELSADYPLRLTTGRRLDSYNTGVQSSGYASPMRRGETIDMCPDDASSHGLAPGDLARITSRRGSVEAPVSIDTGLRPGLVFMSVHFPDEVDTNKLTIEATDPVSGTAEFKATAVRVEKVAEGR